jgi:uncharacterized membrane protein (UPF0127 family)
MKKVTNIIILIVFLAIVGLVGYKLRSNFKNLNLNFLAKSTPAPTVVPSKIIKIDNIDINVEVVNTEADREKGLSGRSSLGEKNGMLFSFEQKHISAIFWMKGMLFPLDIVWISDGKVVKIDKNAPSPKEGISDREMPTYSPGTLIDYVLEVNAGSADKNGIKVGSIVDLSKI